jgi:hypothetical protein
MSNCTRYLGLDVHAETITAAIAEGRGRIRSLGKFPNRPEAVRKLTEKLGGGKNLKVCYEAGPTGYALYWQLTKLGVDCEVVAPSLIPKKAGDKVKTDRRDAEKLAQSYQSGDLTPVWVPSLEHEACVIWSASAPPPRVSQARRQSGGGRCTRAGGLHLGHRDTGGVTPGRQQQSPGSVIQLDGKQHEAKTERPRQHGKENPRKKRYAVSIRGA